MNILFLSDESPIFPAGGIGVYIGYMAEALAAAGHRVFLLTWRQRAAFVPPASHAPFHPENVHVEKEELLRLELNHFAECVAMHKTPMVTGEDGKRALELAMQVLARMKMVKARSSQGMELIALAG